LDHDLRETASAQMLSASERRERYWEGPGKGLDDTRVQNYADHLAGVGGGCQREGGEEVHVSRIR